MNTSQYTTQAQSPVIRTFWFGVICTIPAVLYVFGEVFDGLMTRAWHYQNFIRTVSDAKAYEVLARFWIGDSYYYFSIILNAVTAIAVLLLAWRKGFITRERLKFWRVLKEYSGNCPGGIAGLVVRFILAVLLVYLVYDKKSAVLNVLPTGAYILLFPSFYGFYDTAFYMSLLMLPKLFLVFAVSSLIYALMSSLSVKEFAVKGSVSVIGLLILITTYISINMFADYLDLDKYVDDIPGVTLQESPRSILALSENTMHISICDNYFDCMISSTFDRYVPVTDKNANAVRMYMESRDYMTGLRSACFSFLAMNEMRKLDIYGAVVLHLETLEITDDVMPGLFAIQRIKNSPATKRYRALLYDLTDGDRFSIEGSSALILGKAFAKFGDLEKARYWHNKGVSTGAELSDRTREIYKVTDVAPFNAGWVTGVLTLDGRKCEGQRIGIALRKIDKNISRLLDEGCMLSPYFDLNSVIDGTATDSEGRFSFSGLGEDEYVLLLSLEDVPGKKYRVLNSPGPIAISEKNPSVDVGTIKLVLEPDTAAGS